MVNSGSIIINAMLQKLTKPKMSNAEKFDYVTDYIKRMAGGKLRNETIIQLQSLEQMDLPKYKIQHYIE